MDCGKVRTMVLHGQTSRPLPGLVRVSNSGVNNKKHWSEISLGTYFQNASSSYTSDPVGIAWVTFDSTSGTKGSPTPRIFVGKLYYFSNCPTPGADRIRGCRYWKVGLQVRGWRCNL